MFSVCGCAGGRRVAGAVVRGSLGRGGQGRVTVCQFSRGRGRAARRAKAVARCRRQGQVAEMRR